jgi:hypothetical protein
MGRIGIAGYPYPNETVKAPREIPPRGIYPPVPKDINSSYKPYFSIKDASRPEISSAVKTRS